MVTTKSASRRLRYLFSLTAFGLVLVILTGDFYNNQDMKLYVPTHDQKTPNEWGTTIQAAPSAARKSLLRASGSELVLDEATIETELLQETSERTSLNSSNSRAATTNEKPAEEKDATKLSKSEKEIIKTDAGMDSAQEEADEQSRETTEEIKQQDATDQQKDELSPTEAAHEQQPEDKEQDPIVIGTSTIPSSTDPLRLCTREEILAGQWSKPDHTAPPPYVPPASDSWQRSCYGGSGPLQGYYKTLWMVPGCQFDELAVESFCKVAEGKIITFIGDSITWQQYTSLRLALQAVSTLDATAKQRALVCGNRTEIMWMRDNYLNPSNVRKILDTEKPDILLINRGIHFKPDEELVPYLNDTLRVVEAWHEEHPETVIVWRTTAPGVPGCSGEFAPLNNLEAAIERVANRSWYTIGDRPKFNWYEIEHQNKVVMQMLEDSSIPFEIIDAFELYITRPDQRISQRAGKDSDCLHQCLPGPPDESNRVLQHILQRRAIEPGSHATSKSGTAEAEIT